MSKHLDGTGSDHPIPVTCAHLHTHLDDLTEVPTWSMTDEEVRDTLVELTTLSARVAELEARVAAASPDPPRRGPVRCDLHRDLVGQPDEDDPRRGPPQDPSRSRP